MKTSGIIKPAIATFVILPRIAVYRLLRQVIGAKVEHRIGQIALTPSDIASEPRGRDDPR